MAVLGAAGGIGQPLSLLLADEPRVSHLALFDVAPLVTGVAADVSHAAGGAIVSAHHPALPGPGGKPALGGGLNGALTGADVVVVPAGVPRKPGMSRDDLFSVNAGIVRGLAEACAKRCPGAWVLLVTNPVNSTVPIWAAAREAVEAHREGGDGCADDSWRRRLLGVTALDGLRAAQFWAEEGLGRPELAPRVCVPVIGGHAGATILPLFSRATVATGGVGGAAPLPRPLTSAALDRLRRRVQDAGTAVVEAKGGAGSATLSMARAAARSARACLAAAAGEGGVVEGAFAATHFPRTARCPGNFPDDPPTPPSGRPLPFFARPLRLGVDGVEAAASPPLALARATPAEADAARVLAAELEGAATKGAAFVRAF